MTAQLLEIRGLSRRFGNRTVLDQLDFCLNPQQRRSIAGRSGEGKSTLLRLIAGFDRPNQGELRLHGTLASDGKGIYLAPNQRGLQMVFQDLGLWPSRSVQANVQDALSMQGHGRGEAKARSRAALERLGLWALRRRKPNTLSGGEARRLAFARAMALEPALLLLDEPFASLDPVARNQGFEFLEEVLQATGAAVLLVTHQPQEVLALGGDLQILHEGRLTPATAAAEVCSDPNQFLQALCPKAAPNPA
ncbi:MAG: ATP-binding cassette domain-containing protein [Planctomycetota bacterium]|nr:MAG: ATP-binding cassette domain-containing protein [Planctomycetota bacterium]